MARTKKVLVLYRELAGYTVACINQLAQSGEVKVDVVAWPVHPDAPFEFHFVSGVTVQSRNGLSDTQLRELVAQGEYNLILVSGWADRGYMQAIRTKTTAMRVVAFDTWWFGNFRQHLLAVYSRFKIKPYFDYAFVPGTEQLNLALKLGFRLEDIHLGFYAADLSKFNQLFATRSQSTSANELLYIGRYADEKQIQMLCETFVELHGEGFSDWKLVCAGTGPLFDQRIIHSSIEHKGFCQPEQIADLMRHARAFVLPSKYEPWGVVTQEAAAAGLPLILSSAIGARHAFLKHESNGWLFDANSKSELKTVLKKLFQSSNHDLNGMSVLSHKLAQTYSPEIWSNTLKQLMR